MDEQVGKASSERWDGKGEELREGGLGSGQLLEYK